MQRILWADLEMTGLDPNQHVIIEIAAIVTDLQLENLASFHAIVFQPASELEKMDQWNRDTHGASGLLAQIPAGRPVDEVDRDLLAFVNAAFDDEPVVLAGNSIHQDRKFIDGQMPLLASRLHYRMIDVSSFKQVFRHLYAVEYPKENGHRALDDIQASINELRHYLQFVNITPQVN